jgi:hypothetical protein
MKLARAPAGSPNLIIKLYKAHRRTFDAGIFGFGFNRNVRKNGILVTGNR